jgi:hypothetical protein
VYADGHTTTVLDVRNEECRLVTNNQGRPIDIPILQPNGTRTLVRVREEGASNSTTGPGTFRVSDIQLQGGLNLTTQCGGDPRICTTFGNPPAHAEFNLGPGTNTIHFTNTSNDP